MILGLGLLLWAVSANAVPSAAPPRIARPTPAPLNIPPNVPPLPPAQIDNTLAIGGSDVKAREVDTRLSVDVDVNGSGPYHFLVDSGADTSAVGLRTYWHNRIGLTRPERAPPADLEWPTLDRLIPWLEGR